MERHGFELLGAWQCSGGPLGRDIVLTRFPSIAEYEREFLGGYFSDEPVPLARIRLFEIESTLRKWTTRAVQLRRSTGAVRLAKRTRLAVQHAFYRRYLSLLWNGSERAPGRIVGDALP